MNRWWGAAPHLGSLLAVLRKRHRCKRRSGPVFIGRNEGHRKVPGLTAPAACRPRPAHPSTVAPASSCRYWRSAFTQACWRRVGRWPGALPRTRAAGLDRGLPLPPHAGQAAVHQARASTPFGSAKDFAGKFRGTVGPREPAQVTTLLATGAVGYLSAACAELAPSSAQRSSINRALPADAAASRPRLASRQKYVAQVGAFAPRAAAGWASW